MKHDGRGASILSLTHIDMPAAERCSCLPLCARDKAPGDVQAEIDDFEQVVPATLELHNYLRTALAAFFPRPAPLSLLLLHIAQLEHIHIAPKSAVLHKRQRYHAPATFLEQVLVNIRRTIRASDQVVMHQGTGIAIILPDVDYEGVCRIAERIYDRINLLQPETVIPPLKRETDICIGIGSYPRPGESLEELLYYTRFIAHRLTLRPAVITPLHSILAAHPPTEIDNRRQDEDAGGAGSHAARSDGVPFMQLPTRLPQRLKHLIPYPLACELRCAPVGRDHTRLTVAMAHPTDTKAIQRLREATCMTIFPVACELAALETLLANGW